MQLSLPDFDTAHALARAINGVTKAAFLQGRESMPPTHPPTHPPNKKGPKGPFVTSTPTQHQESSLSLVSLRLDSPGESYSSCQPPYGLTPCEPWCENQ